MKPVSRKMHEMRALRVKVFCTLALLAMFTGCLHEQPGPAHDAGSKAAKDPQSGYTAKIINGQVFLSLNSAPDQVIGPFSKKSDTEYIFETKDEGVHSLVRVQHGWYYSWSHIHMRAVGVDG